MHVELEEVVEDARKWTDEIAERLRALGVSADGRASIDCLDATDKVSEDILIEVVEG